MRLCGVDGGHSVSMQQLCKDALRELENTRRKQCISDNLLRRTLTHFTAVLFYV